MSNVDYYYCLITFTTAITRFVSDEVSTRESSFRYVADHSVFVYYYTTSVVCTVEDVDV